MYNAMVIKKCNMKNAIQKLTEGVNKGLPNIL